MASTKEANPVLWSTSATKTLSDNNWAVSDEFTLNTEDWDDHLWIKADNQGTPASGDTAQIKFLANDGSNNYNSPSGASSPQNVHLTTLDTYNNLDPDGTLVKIPAVAGKFKIAAKGNQTATRNIVLTIVCLTRRGAIA